MTLLGSITTLKNSLNVMLHILEKIDCFMNRRDDNGLFWLGEFHNSLVTYGDHMVDPKFCQGRNR